MNKINIILITLFVLFNQVLFSQVTENSYFWSKKDTVEIVYKEILQNKSYKTPKLTWNTKRLVGTSMMVTFGVLTYYYHQQADDAFSRYKRSGSISEMNSYFKKAEKFDTFKGAASIGIQVGFMLNVWSFL